MRAVKDLVFNQIVSRKLSQAPGVSVQLILFARTQMTRQALAYQKRSAIAVSDLIPFTFFPIGFSLQQFQLKQELV